MANKYPEKINVIFPFLFPKNLYFQFACVGSFEKQQSKQSQPPEIIKNKYPLNMN
jgi:hypothetical protein